MRNLNKNVLVIGAGEIGTSVIGLYSHLSNYTVFYKDINIITTDKAIDIDTIEDYIGIDVLHICITYNESFIDVINKYIFKYKPLMTFIHSTVKTGTTRTIVNKTKSKVFYTPVMGIHPNLTKSLKTFKKIVAVIDYDDREMVLNHFNDIRLTPVFYDNPEEAEAAKLFSTSYYGVIIRFMQDVYEYCETNDLDFDNVYTKTNLIYNEGYKKMNMEHVVRPVLTYGGRGIGGHCIHENAELISEDMYLPTVETIIEEGKNDNKGGFASKNKNDNK